MCGIGGFFLNHAVDNDAITAVFSSLSNRGPDAQQLIGWDNEWNKIINTPYKALMHTRLSIRDPRPIANQPMPNNSKDIWICYNGEVYGWEIEKNELIKRGHYFNTHSDTEFILHAYEEWGLDGMINRLRGMFALAILDLKKKKLHLIRDRMGLKPILYSHDPKTGNFIFASLVRAILPLLPSSRRQLSPKGIDAYLTHRYIPAPNTIFQNINRLENGHMITYDIHSGEIKKKQYWVPEATHTNWQTTLDDAIRIRLESDRPLGMFLSGGIDSGVIASGLHNISASHLPHAFTAAFPGTTLDESNEAKELADRLGIPFTSHSITMPIKQDFATIIRDLDEPISSPSAFPSWYLARHAAKKVSVVLSGDGGDEIFGGYKRYRQHLRSSWHREYRTKLPILSSCYRKGWKKILAESTMNWIDAYSLRFSGFTINQRKYLQPDYLFNNHYWRTAAIEHTYDIRDLVKIDIENYLPEYVLRTSDLCTMAHGLELRAPLIDHEFYQSILSIPDEQRFTTPPKALFASYAKECIPILNRKKHGFNPPLDKWLKEDLLDRFDGLGERLHSLSNGQLSSNSCIELTNKYLNGGDFFAEQTLQLLMLDESLSQLTNY